MVKIQTSKEITPKIYAYTTPKNLDNEGWIKIGYTERDVKKRIKEQTHTAHVTTDILWSEKAEYLTEPDKGATFSDHDFHHFLKFHDVERRPKTEWFYFNGEPDRAKHLFDKFVVHDVSDYQPGQGQDYVLRQEQEAAVEQTAAYMAEHPSGKYLWNAKPRFGKTLATYDLICRTQAQSVLIVTNRPAIANSWFDDFNKFIAGKTNYKFVSESDSLKDRPVLSRKDYMDYVLSHLDETEEMGQIAFLSLQDLKGSIFLGGRHNKLKWVTDTEWDLLVIDEAHEGVDTFKTDTAFNQIKRNFTLHLSGTPFKALVKGDFSADQIFNWSYADEQKAKLNWERESEKENPYESLPQLNLFTYQMSQMIGEKVADGVQLDGENVDYAFDLNEFFSTDESGKFVYEQAVKNWLGTLSTNEKYPFSTKELRNELKHTFWLLDRVASAKALKALLEEHPIYENYKIVLAAGDGRMSEEDDRVKLKALDAVREAIQTNDKTITLSVGQLTTGVTIPEWSAVLMLSNIKSPALYMQAAFRAQNPHSWSDDKGNHYRKENAYVFDFAPERTLQLFDEFANNLSLATVSGGGTTTTREENSRELLNFFPVIAEDHEGKMVKIDAKSVLTIPRQIKAKEVLKRGFMSNLLFDNIAGIFRATQTVLDILDQLPVAEQGKVNKSSENGFLDFSNVNVDESGDVVVPPAIVESQQTKLFGEKIYGLGNSVSTVIAETKDTSKASFVNQLTKEVAPVLVNELKAEYGLKSRETKDIENQVKETIANQVKNHEVKRQIAEAHLQEEYQEKIDQANDKAEKEILKADLDQKLEESKQNHDAELKENLKETVTQLPEALIEQIETKQAEKIRDRAENDIRGHLRGFARTIPSFIMAYGDEYLTLDNFDTYVPEAVFSEVTGIGVEQFRYLRDGGKDFEGHLFDRQTFDEAIQEFLRKKDELSNYFEDVKEDIFDYIPPQKTNQIFTPKRVVKRMVDDLEKENPGIFDDPNKTFLDPYMKSGLYITELVKRLYNSKGLKGAFPDEQDRIKHILEKQVFGFAPTEIIYKICINYIFGNLPETISRDNFVQEDTIPAVKEGKLQELVDRYFG
ncbi:DEAD/DEAH box helicase family protein [Streptococcus danieliae]|uniref:DEAD/DEAH box helicase family protein n=1 Tax=Streptococcus danieliae TaxID=747656 RepID=UPI0021C63F8C|nr:DEAD/DEAH box helicase family protein [Streptococcus danieliae]MCU0082990.1 DEAD/DEAH box helicase family protein [Streptococcus danieliae]